MMNKSNLQHTACIFFFLFALSLAACKNEKEKMLVGKWAGKLEMKCDEYPDRTISHGITYEFNKDGILNTTEEAVNPAKFYYNVKGDSLILSNGVNSNSYSMYIDHIAYPYLRLTDRRKGCLVKLELTRM
jgi:hypothetical protein